jgi:hypothetical protein
MSDAGVMLVSMREIERQIRVARIAVEESKRIEEKSGYGDALLSMDRTYNEGWRDALDYAYVVLNGHGYDEQ